MKNPPTDFQENHPLEFSSHIPLEKILLTYLFYEVLLRSNSFQNMPDSLKELIRVMSFLPGIGEKTATKLAYFLLQTNINYLDNFSHALQNLHTKIDICPTCGSFVNA